jgi:hypothetical protein
VCFIHRFPKSRYSIIDCVKEGVAEVQKEWFKIKDKIRDKQIFVAFSCCYDCYML